ncbi:MAG: SUF system NifU family Fe-S cluster assembly protein [Dehalococcoidia bacterium]|nr:SUF system NifU family Fe-S cluster assembly protein [Dehalococcoidia bacterium]
MSSVDLRELYQDLIREHNSKPRNFHALEGANRKVDGYNPLCGDKLTVYLKVTSDVIQDVGIQGSGCAISRASASLMSENVKGKTVAQAEKLFKAFRAMITREPGADFDADALGDLEVFSGVSEYPARVKCATLPWHTMHAALAGKGKEISTE